MSWHTSGDRGTSSLTVGGIADAAPVRTTGSSPGAGNADIARLLAPMRRHRRLLLVATIFFAAAAAAYVRWELPLYRATATIRLDDLRREVTVGIEAPQKASEPMTSPVVSEIQLLRSRELVGRVVDSLGLRLRPDFRHFSAPLLADVRVGDAVAPDTLQLRFDDDTVRVEGKRLHGHAAYGKPLQLQGLSFTITAKPPVRDAVWHLASREGAIDAVLAKLVVYPRVFSDVVDVSYVGERPTIVRRVVNGIVQGFVDAGAEAATAAARKRREFLETQMRQNDSLLGVADAELIAFRRRVRVFSTPARIDAQQREVLDLAQRSAELKGSRQVYQTLLAEVEAERAGTRRGDALRSLGASPDLAANPAIATVVQQLLAQERVLDSLRTGAWRSAPTDPYVERTEALISDNQEKLLGLVRGYISAIDARATSLDQMGARATSSLVALPAIDAEDARLSRRVNTLANLGEYVRGEYQKARIAEGAAIGRAVVLDTAFTPYKPVAQFRALKIIVGAVAGLLFSALIAAIIERRNTSVRRREDLEAGSFIPVLGVVPRLIPTEVIGRHPLKRSHLLPRLGKGSDAHALDEPHSVSASPGAVLNAYRMLRANVARAWPRGVPRSIVITSASPGDGKTTVAANLALAFALEGRRVLLVDGDLRRSTVHRMFKVPRSPGLAELLDGSAEIKGCVHPSNVDGLFVLPAGEPPVDGGHLLEGESFRKLLDELRESFDLLVIDTAPALAVADAAVVGPLADGVLVVVRAGVTDRADAVEAMRQLAAAGANVVGGVINDPAGHMVERSSSYYQEYATT